jgi:hypothetical protein
MNLKMFTREEWYEFAENDPRFNGSLHTAGHCLNVFDLDGLPVPQYIAGGYLLEHGSHPYRINNFQNEEVNPEKIFRTEEDVISWVTIELIDRQD